ncbi:hypothetical protein AGABI2DRAFT_186783 [Agaricus bisporus var. bisporus H97]|uniref:hypothetical protein n=1 Tax=Agaricus bisporus var. bisporus (strain H97 / ATCC MYA-4626 / FGSC 10389) TaxID=936046 RepID=UPI00029F64CA|nr:hypothetical protein AGABI2DRAFT_186783 [Agaricus bisporus var. bisporus H97]EKV46162.1 hypothetical protein AGABI2DRAFT_186783 [Agaricus bisporus var. bisporus H97]
MSLCKDCFRGARHEGTAEGELTTVDGVRVYIAKPPGDYPKDKAIRFLSDVFGLQLINNKLLADDLARNGFYTVIPDFLNGDAISDEMLDEYGKFDIPKWLLDHTAGHTRPPLNKVIAWLKEQGFREFGAVGFCFGARYVFHLAFEDAIKVAVVSHPSLIKVPDDLERYRKEAKAPLLINSCTIDVQFPLEAQEQADRILGEGKYEPGYKREYFKGCTHGFAVRGDMSDPKVKAGKEGSFKATVEWFSKYL